ncbi:MAG: transglutaminase domain-containing protein [Patescibacteria group bacterium]|nr:transglutaminase domain-containing protein [Patescibacteria group bacterium]
MLTQGEKQTVTPLHNLSDTVGQMKRLIDSYYEDMRFSQTMSLQEIHDFLKFHVPYVRDGILGSIRGLSEEQFNAEVLQRPAITLQRGGDCDDKVIAAASYCKLKNIPYVIVTTSYRPDKEMEHVYLYIWYGGTWQPFDVTMKSVNIFQELPYTAHEVWR